MPLTKSERPGSRPRAVPAPLHRADNGRARGMSIYPRRGPINTDHLWAAINPLQPKVGK